jgi:glycosyltransferase involved in cell wall biosynthesis
MKKSLAFVIPSLDAGGGEKSLVNLLGTIDTETYDVDLIVLHKRGIFVKSVPKTVNILTPSGDFKIFSLPFVSSLKTALLKGKFGLFFNRIAFTLKYQLLKSRSDAEQSSWKNLGRSVSPIEKEYDAAIGFLEKTSVYFAVDKINAKKKIGFIHTNYIDMKINADFDRPYFQKLDAILTVSDECVSALKTTFPEFAPKIKLMHNIVSPRLIHTMAAEPVSDMPGTQTLVSIGRLHHEKGFDIAIGACAWLVKNGYDVKWYLIGEGKERTALEKQIADSGLEAHFVLLGLRDNPYPYIKNATIFVHASRLEGKSIAIDEAKILAKPIVVTNFTTVYDQITHLQNGYIAEMMPESVALAIKTLLDDEALRQSLSANLLQENLGTEREIEILYDLIES